MTSPSMVCLFFNDHNLEDVPEGFVKLLSEDPPTTVQETPPTNIWSECVICPFFKPTIFTNKREADYHMRAK